MCRESKNNVREGQYSPTARGVLHVMGDRLQEPGKESLTFTGTYDDYASSQKNTSGQITLICQYPGLGLVDFTGAAQSVAFNGNQVTKHGRNVNQKDTDLVEAVVKDTANSVTGVNP